LGPTPPAAGAWIAPEGGQEIVTSAVGERDELTFYESSAYWEVPFAANVALVASPWVEQNYDTIDGWRGEAVLGLKRAVFRRGETVMAVQAGALWVSHPPLGCSEGGAELRWLGGRAFDDGAAFLNLEAAGRALEGGCEGGRVDLTVGYRANDRWMGMAQLFFDAPGEAQETLKAQLTLVRFGDEGAGVQLGLRGRIDGGAEEAALVLGFWGRPGE
jgi:hypothetical protein